jgi:outer membrane protein OmpA-like peptidoglycan-associated protein
LGEFRSLFISNKVFKINLNPISFTHDSGDITKTKEKQLKVLIYHLIKYPANKIKLESPADARRRDVYHDKLSVKRSQSVKDYLVSKEVKPDRIVEIKSFGEKELINDCNDGILCSD